MSKRITELMPELVRAVQRLRTDVEEIQHRLDQIVQLLREQKVATFPQATKPGEALEQQKEDYRKRYAARPIDELEFSTRIRNSLLTNTKIKTIGDLLQLTKVDVMMLPALGKKSWREVAKVLEQHGLKLKEGGGDKESPYW